MNTPKRVLVVDDDLSIRELIEMALVGAGYDVNTAADGAVGLSVAKGWPPDVILLDMRMPVVDGAEFARRYRATPGRHAPIVVMTAAADISRPSAETAAEGALPKPFHLEELFAIIRKHT